MDNESITDILREMANEAVLRVNALPEHLRAKSRWQSAVRVLRSAMNEIETGATPEEHFEIDFDRLEQRLLEFRAAAARGENGVTSLDIRDFRRIAATRT